MEQFTIYCTEEQCKKAELLGAPIEKVSHSLGEPFKPECTSEQMIGFLATKGVFVGVAWDYINKKWESYTHVKNKMIGCDDYASREEATHAAIDEALDYLKSRRK